MPSVREADNAIPHLGGFARSIHALGWHRLLQILVEKIPAYP